MKPLSVSQHAKARELPPDRTLTGEQQVEAWSYFSMLDRVVKKLKATRIHPSAAVIAICEAEVAKAREKLAEIIGGEDPT